MLTTLLYGCETWTLYRRSIRRLDQFHLRCLRKIARVKWQDRIPNTDVLITCGNMGIEAFLLKAQLRWVGHIMRMPDSRIPKQVFLGQLASGKRLQCGPVLRYKDAVKVNLKQCGIDPSTLRIAQPGELCATKQSPSSKIRESKLWHIKEQFGRGLNLAATSVLGHVTAALASAVPELDSTPINELTDDMRSFFFEGAVCSFRPSVHL